MNASQLLARVAKIKGRDARAALAMNSGAIETANWVCDNFLTLNPRLVFTMGPMPRGKSSTSLTSGTPTSVRPRPSISSTATAGSRS